MPDDAPKVAASPPAAPPPAPVPTPAPAPQANEAAVPAVSPSGLTPDEEAQLGRLLAKRSASEEGGTERLRISPESGHSSMEFGGVTVRSDWTDVPARLVPHLFNAAADAGVTIERES